MPQPGPHQQQARRRATMRAASGLAAGLAMGGLLGLGLRATLSTSGGGGSGSGGISRASFFLDARGPNGAYVPPSRACSDAAAAAEERAAAAAAEDALAWQDECNARLAGIAERGEAAKARLVEEHAAAEAAGQPPDEVLACELFLEQLDAPGSRPLPPFDIMGKSRTGTETLALMDGGPEAARLFLGEGRPRDLTGAPPRGLFFARSYTGFDPPLDAETASGLLRRPLALAEAPGACHQTDVIPLEPGTCYAFLGTESSFPSEAIHRVGYSEADGWYRLPPSTDDWEGGNNNNNNNKSAAARREGGLAPPSLEHLEAHEAVLQGLYAALPDLAAALTPLLRDAAPEQPLDLDLLPVIQEQADAEGKDITDRPTGAGLVVVLVVGEGQGAELVNQACWKHRHMEPGNQGRVVVLAETEAEAALARALGYTRVATPPHPALREMRDALAWMQQAGELELEEEQEEEGPRAAAAAAAVDAAARLWLQALAAWLVVREGFDALVHGPEHAWLRHWSEALNDQGPLSGHWFDLALLPASATNPSPGPHHATLPGLLFARSNLRTLHALRQILFQYDHALADPASAPAVALRVIEDLQRGLGLRVLRTEPQDFAPSLADLQASPIAARDAYGALLTAADAAAAEAPSHPFWRGRPECLHGKDMGAALGKLEREGPTACCLASF